MLSKTSLVHYCAVIQAFTKISGYLDYAKQCNDVSILIGGGADKR